MLIAEEAVGWSQVVSGLAALALTWLAKNARSLRRFVFDLWNKLERASKIIDKVTLKIKQFDSVLESVEKARSVEDISNGVKELRKLLVSISEAIHTLSKETTDEGFSL